MPTRHAAHDLTLLRSAILRLAQEAPLTPEVRSQVAAAIDRGFMAALARLAADYPAQAVTIAAEAVSQAHATPDPEQAAGLAAAALAILTQPAVASAMASQPEAPAAPARPAGKAAKSPAQIAHQVGAITVAALGAVATPAVKANQSLTLTTALALVQRDARSLKDAPGMPRSFAATIGTTLCIMQPAGG